MKLCDFQFLLLVFVLSHQNTCKCATSEVHFRKDLKMLENKVVSDWKLLLCSFAAKRLLGD